VLGDLRLVVVDLTDETVFAELVVRTNLRAAVDRVTPRQPITAALRQRGRLGRRVPGGAESAQAARAAALRAEIDALKTR